MNNTNTIVVTGNLVKDPVIKETSEDKVVVNATIAHNHSKTSVSYFDIESWNDSSNQEELKSAKKGQRMEVTGYLKQERWETDGKINSRVKIIATSLAANGNKS